MEYLLVQQPTVMLLQWDDDPSFGGVVRYSRTRVIVLCSEHPLRCLLLHFDFDRFDQNQLRRTSIMEVVMVNELDDDSRDIAIFGLYCRDDHHLGVCQGNDSSYCIGIVSAICIHSSARSAPSCLRVIE